jgi:amino acid transporter
MSRAAAGLKRLVVGLPKSSAELEHTLLPKIIALPVFSSDPLSSNAYATQEILLVLALAGNAALSLVVPISAAVAMLLTIVVISYRQTVRAYPNGGGAFRVSYENLGIFPGLLAASALLTDYVMTVAVSVVAGVDAIVSAAPGLEHLKVEIALLFVLFVTLANLRGVKESGILFAFPTYGFVLSIYAMIITGAVKCLGGCPAAETAGTHLPVEHALGFFLILKAFSAGTTALTGVEAISDGVQAFRYPQSRNAATTLAMMGVLSISMFAGITLLARFTGVIPSDDPGAKTVVAQIAHAVFGTGPMFYFVQVMTAAILILAANTAYQDFPRLSSILARERFMPRQFLNRGDRLVFSNGVIVLALLASLLIIVFKANLTSLIQLYLVGVFISFTMSQFGMVLRWKRRKGARWQRSLVINACGGTITGIVFFVVVSTKFGRPPHPGAWIVVTVIPIVMYAMFSVYRHYTALARELEHPERRPADRRPGNQHMVIVVNGVDAAAARAVGYARSVRPSSIAAITLDKGCAKAWDGLAPEIELTVLSRSNSHADSIKSYVRRRREELADDDFLTLIVPEILQSRSLFEVLRRPATHRLKGALIREPGIQVLDIPVVKEDITSADKWTQEPARNYCVVLASRVHNALLQAIEYAETLRPTSIRAVTFGLDTEETAQLGDEWLEAQIPHPLEIEDSPFRDIGPSLLDYVRRFHADGVERVVTVIIPEFIVAKRRHQILHGHTALIVKRHLLFEPGIVVVSVPYHVATRTRAPHNQITLDRARPSTDNPNRAR